MGSDPKLTRRMGCMVPHGPGIYEVAYMGRRMKVHVNRDGTGELKVFGVPGHPTDGLPLTDFDGYTPPRIDDSRRSYTANLSEFDRAMSRSLAGLAALRAALEKRGTGGLYGEDMESTVRALLEEEEMRYCYVTDREGVEKAVKERLGVWSIEDRDGIPLPSYGPGAPPEGRDVNGRDV